MQDEHFMRQWNAGHVRFSDGLDRKLMATVRGIGGYLASLRSIDSTYHARNESPLARKARLTENALIGGLTSGTGLALLLLTLPAVLSPETSHAVSSVCLAAPAFA